MSTSNRESPEVATLYKWSWRDRLWHTPLRDILKGNLSGTRDFQYSVRTSGLPKSAINTIVKTVCATRLSRNEKIEVSRELVAHFQDALYGRQNDPQQRTECSQAEVERVVHEFGNPTAVAKLIRATMIRKRPLHWRIAHAALQVLGVLILLAILVLSIRFIRFVVSEPNVTRDFIAEHNSALLQTPDDQRAWPRYKQVLPAVLMDIANDPAWPNYAGVEPTSPHWPDQLAQVQRLQSEISIIRQAAQLPTLGTPLLTSPDPELAPYREQEKNTTGFVRPANDQVHEAAPYLFLTSDESSSDIDLLSRLMAADAYAAISQRDGNRLVMDLETMIAMARQTHQTTFHTRVFRAAGMYHRAAHVLTIALMSESPFLTDSHLKALDVAFASLGDRERVRVDLSGERARLEDVLQRLYSDNGQGDGHLTLQGVQTLSRSLESISVKNGFRPSPERTIAEMLVSEFLFNAASAGRKQTLDKFDQIAADFAKNYDRPMWEWDTDRENLTLVKECKDNILTLSRYSWLCINCMAYSYHFETAEAATQTRDVMRVAIALARYHLANKAHPPTLESLIPTYLDRIGPDRMDGSPMRYIIKSGKPLVYSVGVDRIDDSGRSIRNDDAKVRFNQRWISQAQANEVRKSHRPLRFPFDGDVILWPKIGSYINKAENVMLDDS